MLQLEEKEVETVTEIEFEPAENELLTTPDVLPIKGIGRGCLALAGGGFSVVGKLEGQDIKLMSFHEKGGIVRRFGQIFNSMNGPFAFYCVSKPRDMRSYLAELDRKRAAELNPHRRQQYWVESNFISKLSEGNSLTQRDFYFSVNATAHDLKSSADMGEEDDDKPRGLFQTFTSRLKEVLGQDQSQPNLKEASGVKRASRSGDERVPAHLSDAILFKGQSMADQFNNNGMPARLLGSEDLIYTLGGILGSATTSITGRASSPLFRIGGFALEERPDYLKLTDTTSFTSSFVGSLYVTDFPKHLRLGALFEIIRFKDIQMFMALQVKPLANQQAENKLKNRQQILWAVAATDNSSAGDMSRSYKIESIKDLRNVLARGDARLFSAGIRISVRANTLKKMQSDLRRVAQRLTEMGYPVATAIRNQRRAFFSALPIGLDLLGQEKFMADRTLHPNMTGENLACLMPNCIVDASQYGGIILGVNKADGSLVTFNRWLQINPHTIIIATTGSGKTVAMLIEMLREMLKDPALQAFYIDPQGVLSNFARLVNGTVLDLGPKGNAIINPLDRFVLNGHPEEIGERLNFLFALVELMTRAELSATERSTITRAGKRLYHHFEEGESMLRLLELTFMNNSLYAPLRPFLRSYLDPQTGERKPGVMVQLKAIYDRLREKYKIPSTGLVHGQGLGKNYKRPICTLGSDNRWYYAGAGETSEPFVEPESLKARKAHDPIPAAVWYPDPTWFKELAEDFSNLVQDEGVFDSLDLMALSSAIRDSFVELKMGMPILSDLMPFLAAEGAVNLVNNLEQYVDPEVFGKMFNGYTNVALDRRFISFNVRDLGEELLRPIRIFQAINFTWGMVRAVNRPRMFVADEFGILVQNFHEVGDYMKNLFMRGRHFNLSMTVIVQNVTSLLDYQAALQCVENADRVILMRQQKSAIHRLKAHYDLTDGQVHTLLGAEPGEALERVDNRWIHVKYSIDPQHLKAFDTRPQQTREVQDSSPQELALWR
ncbi:MAG: hypothetical protein J0I20_29135 [Chloroflexi bacterium]|jgi:hypothetical protein|nr:hypothetical protein [Chloroflexota bacterium]OJV91697.1 MAG: hypothetical protein BGO39_32970 [Chloroflexi bacterium 54-19]